MEGEIIRIQKDRVRKKKLGIDCQGKDGEEKQILISSLHNIRKDDLLVLLEGERTLRNRGKEGLKQRYNQ